MARWNPGTQGRLEQAALELFTDHGYDNVTVARIAERAGITRRSFFRYFPDKREVLFGGSERLSAAVAQAVLAADADDAPVTAVFSAFSQVGARLADYVDHAAERRAVIETSPDLQEGDRTKLADLAGAVGDALVQRGVEPGSARIVARVAAVFYQEAFERWVDAGGEEEFGSCLLAAAASLQEVR
ncbi:TetR family transcriptional regulator [Streptomonospora nanhaiensis]|uniref:TetR family transcriptional regulator n=1 Tax=Streptomonospora nanhaiensis TaxID=1323731 RepID=A0ABY6YFB6_9ACTN|nr:TetR/AcrR family transcriptional regulator [Streptomonospora nanhaiensis]WAE70924.1 TetR family transcriptional regulator [Streptomonospora nanhaiensis]